MRFKLLSIVFAVYAIMSVHPALACIESDNQEQATQLVSLLASPSPTTGEYAAVSLYAHKIIRQRLFAISTVNPADATGMTGGQYPVYNGSKHEIKELIKQTLTNRPNDNIEFLVYFNSNLQTYSLVVNIVFPKPACSINRLELE